MECEGQEVHRGVVFHGEHLLGHTTDTQGRAPDRIELHIKSMHIRPRPDGSDQVEMVVATAELNGLIRAGHEVIVRKPA